ncbi:MAG: V-type ATPase subunit [Oscillospiraceae bacterium]|nr:V-type ATPase subunit [Oscillospiraceae bacterium]
MAENKIAYSPVGTTSCNDYVYLGGMIEMRLKEMLSFAKMEQLLNSGSAENAARLLTEAGWPNMRGMNRTEIDEALNERRKAIFHDIACVVPEDEVVEVLRLKYDYHNAKTIVKSEAMGAAAGDICSDMGRVDAKKLKAAYDESDYRFVPSALGKAMEEAKSILAKTQNPQMADLVLDKAYFAEMMELCENVEPNPEPASFICAPEAQDPFMIRYRRLLIDSANLRTCVRCLRMGKNEEFLRSALIPNGTVSAERMAHSAMSGEGLAPMFTTTPLQEAAVLGMAAVKGGSLTKFEKECEDAVLRHLTNLRMMYFGPELVIWYLSVVETNITNVRMILTGMQAGVAPDRLKERLRETYV